MKCDEHTDIHFCEIFYIKTFRYYLTPNNDYYYKIQQFSHVQNPLVR